MLSNVSVDYTDLVASIVSGLVIVGVLIWLIIVYFIESKKEKEKKEKFLNDYKELESKVESINQFMWALDDDFKKIHDQQVSNSKVLHSIKLTDYIVKKVVDVNEKAVITDKE